MITLPVHNNVVNFGLVNVPSTFERLMEDALRGFHYHSFLQFQSIQFSNAKRRSRSPTSPYIHNGEKMNLLMSPDAFLILSMIKALTTIRCV